MMQQVNSSMSACEVVTSMVRCFFSRSVDSGLALGGSEGCSDSLENLS